MVESKAASSIRNAVAADSAESAVLEVLADWLAAGRVLINAAQMADAAAEAWEWIHGAPPGRQEAAALEASLDSANRRIAETLLVPGMENWIIQAAVAEVKHRGWGVTEVQEHGAELVRELLHRSKVQRFLKELGLSSTQLNIRRCMRAVQYQAAGKADPRRQQARARLQKWIDHARRCDSQAPSSAASGRLNRLWKTPAPLPEETEISTRNQIQRAERRRLRAQQMGRLLDNIDAYVAEDRISAEDARRLVQLVHLDRAERQGRIAPERDSKIRNTLLSGKARERIEKKVRDTVDHVVVYQQVFCALKRIDPRFDPALRFLVRHKETVNADQRESSTWRQVTEQMIEDLDVLYLLIDIMDRQDAEVRMIAARLPPYNRIIRRSGNRIDNLAIGEDFIDELRQLSDADIATRLNAADPAVRSKTAAAMLSLTTLVARIIKPTPFRKELRLLKINLIIEEFYRSEDDVAHARQRAQEFLRTRMSRLLPDLSAEETLEIERRGTEIIQQVEQRVGRQRARAPECDPVTGAAGGGGGEEARADGEAPPQPQLEQESGVIVGRVLVRTATGNRLVPYRIMPDAEKSGHYVLARLDPHTGQIHPVMRRGRKRYVVRNRDGIWEVV